jgi:hypothetical protein
VPCKASLLLTCDASSTPAEKQAVTPDPWCLQRCRDPLQPVCLLCSCYAAGGLHEHEGIVEADQDSGDAWLLQQQQHWMARQLFNAMPPCVVCERRLQLTSHGSAAGGDGGTSGTDGANAAAAADVRGEEQSEGTADATAAAAAASSAADAAVGVQVPGGSGCSARGLTGGSIDSKTQTAGCGSSSSSSVGMSKGGWHRVDVWTGHVHAHATIIVRDKRYESQSRDLFAYLVNHMSL